MEITYVNQKKIYLSSQAPRDEKRVVKAPADQGDRPS